MILSVLILTRNRQAELTQCLSSLKREFEEGLEVVVLDNGSEPPLKSSDFVAFPKLKLLRSDRNLGVAAGRNILAKKASGDLLWFLDDDAILEAANSSELVQRYFKDPAVGIVSFRVINQLTGREETRCIPDRNKQTTQSDLPASYFAGCSFIVRKKAFVEAGGFWEPLFYSCEELDFSYRFMELKYTIIRSSVLTVKHAYIPSSVRTTFWIYYNARNRFWMALRNLPWRYVFSQALLWWGYTGWISLRQRQSGFWISAVQDSLRGTQEALRERKVVSHQTLRSVRQLGGRTWY